jgi:site-specific DNA recombinase
MAEPPARCGPLQVYVEYAFDSLHESKLAQLYSILVPGREQPVGGRVRSSIMRMTAIYARVWSEQQREENTIASQTAALIECAKDHDLEVPKEWAFEDKGYSGATLERPGLERVRDLASEGQIQTVLVYAPDRLSRKYAYQILLIEELARNGVETLFVKAPQGASAEDQLLVQFQGLLAAAG